jgi:hypothetical protein
VETLKLLPQIVKGVVREAADGELKLPFESDDLAALKAGLERANASREQTWLAAVLWLSGMVWLGVDAAPAWLGWTQLIVAVVWLAAARWSRRRAARRGA